MRIDFNEEAAKEAVADGAEPEVQPEAEVTNEEGAEPTSGWVIEVKAHHFHNSDNAMVDVMAGKQFVRKTLVKNLLTKRNVTLPDHPGLEFTYSDLGVSHPTIVWVSEAPVKDKIIFDPSGGAGADEDGSGTKGSDRRLGAGDVDSGSLADIDESNIFDVKLYAFVIQMAWVPRSEEEILAARTERLAAEEAAAKAEAEKNSQAENS